MSLERLLAAIAESEGDDKSGAALNKDITTEGAICSIVEARQRLSDPIDYDIGDFVQFKDGLNYAKFPRANMPAMVVKFLDAPINAPTDDTGNTDVFSDAVVAAWVDGVCRTVALDRRYLRKDHEATAIADRFRAELNQQAAE